MSTRRILIVDDEPDVVESLKFRLDRAGYEVLSADNGALALEVLRKERFDLILADFMMPEVNGIELARLVKSHPSWFDTKVLLFSCNTAPEFKDRAMAMGAVDYLPKTAGASRIIERVSELVGPAEDSDAVDAIGPALVAAIAERERPAPLEPAVSQAAVSPPEASQPIALGDAILPDDGEDVFRNQLASLSRSLIDVLHLAQSGAQPESPTEYAIDSAKRIAQDIQRLSTTSQSKQSQPKAESVQP